MHSLVIRLSRITCWALLFPFFIAATSGLTAASGGDVLPDEQFLELQHSSTPQRTLLQQPQPQYTCDRLGKVPPAERCDFVLANCESDSRFPYTKWYYCHVAPRGIAASFFFTLLLAALLPLFFTLLGDTAEIYFSPIMTHVAQSIPKMRPRFAGVTFVAMGNGATDLSANITAIRNGDVLLSAGALTGAAMFVQCVVASEVMRASRGPVKCRGATLRDLAIYVASVLMVLAAFWRGRINGWFISGAILLYLSYVIWVFLGDEWHERGRPEAVAVWRSFRSGLENRLSWLRGQPPEDVVPWALLEDGPPPPHATATTTAATDNNRNAIDQSQPTQCQQQHHPQQRRHQAGQSHLVSAKAYQNMVWAALSPKDEAAVLEGQGTGRGRRRQGRRSRGRQGVEAGRGTSGAGAGGWRQDVALEMGTATAGGGAGRGGGREGYAPPIPPTTSATPVGPIAVGAGSQLVTLSSMDGSALPAPATIEATLTSSGPTGHAFGAGTAPSEAGARVWTDRQGPGYQTEPSGRDTTRVAKIDPWVSVGESSGDAASEDTDDEEAQILLSTGRHRGRGASNGGGGGGCDSDDDDVSVASSRRVMVIRSFWDKVQHELTIGASTEWQELPPDSLRRRWRSLTFPMLLPVYLALRLTIPFVDPASYSRAWLIRTCLCAPLLAAAYFATHAAFIVGTILGICLAVLVAYFTDGEEDALPDWDFGTSFAFGPAFFAVFGFFMGIVWIDLLASEVVGVITLLATLLHLPASVMGLTLLAWGNSLGDFFGNPAMARRGQPSMALTACFAGPLFNMLASMVLGFSSYFLRRRVGHADVELRPEVALGCVFLVLYNLIVAGTGVLNHGSLPDRFYVFGRAWYGIYFAAACVLGLWAAREA